MAAKRCFSTAQFSTAQSVVVPLVLAAGLVAGSGCKNPPSTRQPKKSVGGTNEKSRTTRQAKSSPSKSDEKLRRTRQAKPSLASNIELTSIFFDVTDPMPETVVVVVGPDQVEIYTAVLRTQWSRQIEAFRHDAQENDGSSGSTGLDAILVKNPAIDEQNAAEPISLIDGRFPDDTLKGPDKAGVANLFISPLHDQLSQTRHKTHRQATLIGVEASTSLVVAADKDAALSTITKILYTSGQAGYQSFGFLVRAPDGQLATLPLYTPTLHAAPPPAVEATKDIQPLRRACAAVEVTYGHNGLALGVDQGHEYNPEALESAQAKHQGIDSVDELWKLDAQTQQDPDADASDANKPAKPAWAGATLVGPGQQCPSVALNDPTAVGRDLYTLVGVFDSFRVCRSARVNIPTLPGPGRTVESAQQAIAALLADDAIDGVTWGLTFIDLDTDCQKTFRPNNK